MQTFPPTIIIRHKKENLKKCSLRGLESRADFRFYTFPLEEPLDFSQTLLLTLDAPPLKKEDAQKGLLILDATWRYADKMLQVVNKNNSLEKRSIPSCFTTAYPRCQHDCPDPLRGLASLEAIFIAYTILGRDVSNLLDNYYWKSQFLQKNLSHL